MWRFLRKKRHIATPHGRPIWRPHVGSLHGRATWAAQVASRVFRVRALVVSNFEWPRAPAFSNLVLVDLGASLGAWVHLHVMGHVHVVHDATAWFEWCICNGLSGIYMCMPGLCTRVYSVRVFAYRYSGTVPVLVYYNLHVHVHVHCTASVRPRRPLTAQELAQSRHMSLRYYLR